MIVAAISAEASSPSQPHSVGGGELCCIHLYSPNNGSMSEEKIYIRRKISNKNTEAKLNNMRTPRLFE